MKAQHFNLPMALLLIFACAASTAWWQRSAAQPALSPRSLAAGDFDEDGTPDLISGFVEEAGGQLRLSRGRELANFSAPGQAIKASPANAPFYATSATIRLPLAPEFLGVGDFDADGHQDIVVGAKGNEFLFWLRGNGRNEFKQGEKLSLPGTLTSLAAGEVNRADGLTDLAIGVLTPQGPSLLLFEGAAGALQNEPEQFRLPEPAQEVALATFDRDELFDVAVASGKQLLLIRGRDRRLAQDPAHQAAVPPATVDQLSLPDRIDALVTGDFTGQQHYDIAFWLADGTISILQPTSSQPLQNWPRKTLPRVAKLMNVQATTSPHRLISARIAAADTDQLIAVDAQHQQLLILDNQPQTLNNRLALEHSVTVDDATAIPLQSAPVALLPMRLNGDALSDLVILKAGSIEPEFALTTAQNTYTVINNGSGAGSFEQAIHSANASPGLDQIVFNLPNPPSNNTFSNLPIITDAVVIDGTTQPGYAGVPILEISLCANNPASALSITGGNTTVRGFAIHSCGFRGSFSQLGNGIYISERGNNIIEANYIGVNRSGDCQVGFSGCSTYNTNGIFIQRSTNNLIGGTTAAARNLISGNLIGVNLYEEARDNRVLGNVIGPDITGNKLVGSETGVYVYVNANNLIGGTTAGAKNLITAVRLNGIGLYRATGTLVQGNYLGTDAVGMTGSTLVNAVNLTEAPRNTIGGTSPTARNVLAGSIFLSDGSDETSVLGNYIGVDVTGNKFLGGTILVQSRANSIGGVSANARNLIASGMLMRFENCRNNTVQGNYFGVNASGTAALKDYGPINAGTGVEVFNSADNLIGGSTPGAGNLLSALPIGVNIYGQSASGNRVLGNLIGTQADGSSPLGNRDLGIQVAVGNQVGGVETGAGNVIAFNGNGVRGGIIRGNSIHSNVGLGIECCDNGVSANVPNEDHNSPEHQNAPRLTLALLNAAGTSLTVQGRLNSYASSNFLLDLYANPVCDPSGYGEGQTYLGSATLTTGGDFNGTFNFTLPVKVPPGQFITSTATRVNGSTSEFSPCVPVASGCLSVYPLSDQLSAGNILIPRSGGAGSLGVSIQGTCSWVVSSAASWITFTNGTSGNGNGTINFSVAANPGVASRVAVINIGTQKATVVQAGQVAVVSAASFSNSEFTYRGIYAVFGGQLAARNQTATSVPLPTSLAGTTAYLTDQRSQETVQLPLFFVSPGQINLLFNNLPTSKFTGPATLTIVNDNGGVATGEVSIMGSFVAGGLFAANASGQGLAAGVALRVKANGTQTFEPIVRLDMPPNRYAAVPIDLGPETDKVFLILFGTGIGNAGQVVQIGNTEIQPDYLGSQGSLVGVDQVNALLPRSLLGRGEVEVKIFSPPSQRTSNTVRIFIR